MAVSKKRDSIDKLFHSLWEANKGKSVIRFDNTKLKEITRDTKFMNQFDATKFESAEKLPASLKEHGYFIVHLGKGNHAFVKGNGYHTFEKITKWKDMIAGRSVVDAIGFSEAGAISFAANEGIIQDFLKEENLRIHTARRSRVSFKFKIKNEVLHADKQQIEIDGMFESRDGSMVAAVEAKNIDIEDFEIRQLFSIHHYFKYLKAAGKLPRDTKVRILFLVRKMEEKINLFKVFEYRFESDMNLNSIKLVKAIGYRIKVK